MEFEKLEKEVSMFGNELVLDMHTGREIMECAYEKFGKKTIDKLIASYSLFSSDVNKLIKDMGIDDSIYSCLSLCNEIVGNEVSSYNERAEKWVMEHTRSEAVEKLGLEYIEGSCTYFDAVCDWFDEHPND